MKLKPKTKNPSLSTCLSPNHWSLMMHTVEPLPSSIISTPPSTAKAWSSGMMSLTQTAMLTGVQGKWADSWQARRMSPKLSLQRRNCNSRQNVLEVSRCWRIRGVTRKRRPMVKKSQKVVAKMIETRKKKRRGGSIDGHPECGPTLTRWLASIWGTRDVSMIRQDNVEGRPGCWMTNLGKDETFRR